MPALLDAQPLADADVEDLPRGNVPRHEVAVGRVALFEEIRSLIFGNLLRGAGVLRFAGDPNPPPLAADALADQPQLVGAGNGRRVHLDELGVGVGGPGLEAAALALAVQASELVELAEDQAHPAAGDDHGVGRQGADFHRRHVLGDAAAAAALVVEDRPEKVPELVLRHLARDAPAADLLVQGVEQLLAGGGAGEGRAAIERAAEAALVAEALAGAVERHPEPVQEVDDPRGPIDHFPHRRLMLEKLAAVDGVLEVFPFGVVELSREVVDAVDAALRTAAVGSPQGGEAHDARRRIPTRPVSSSRPARPGRRRRRSRGDLPRFTFLYERRAWRRRPPRRRGLPPVRVDRRGERGAFPPGRRCRPPRG